MTVTLRCNVTKPRSTSLIGRRARFRLRDIHFPEASVVLEALHGDDVLQGEVLDLSVSGLDAWLYVVVRVDRLEQPVVVPAHLLLAD
jgi:hypothetical protein